MSAKRLVNRFIELGGHCLPEIVDRRLEQAVQAQVPLEEASVHLPRRGTIWVASFTGSEPGQRITRSTGLTDRTAALAKAHEWEREAREQRAARGGGRPKPSVRVRGDRADQTRGPLTQREVALLLGMSERGVREVERRALAKLANHPQLKQIWRQHLSGELAEELEELTSEERAALLGLARTPAERAVIEKVLRR